jgi:hypothetical protein
VGRLWVVAAFVGLMVPAVQAAGQPVIQTANGRYGLTPAPDGFTRLDTETGDVTHCGPKNGVWVCDRLTAAPPETERRLDALAAEVRRLSAELAALAARVAAPPPPSSADADVAQAREPEPSRATRIAGEAVRRFLDMVRSLKHRDDA